MNKLKGLPRVNFTSLKESEDRREYMRTMLSEHGVTNYSIYETERFVNTGIKVTGKYDWAVNDAEKGVASSHILNILKWYNETDEEYGFFTEDDVSFDTVNYWTFGWEDFILRLPKNWEMVQLLRINPYQTMDYKEENGLKIRKRNWCDWGCHYIITREAAKKILDRVVIDEKNLNFNLEWDLHPFPENVLFYNLEDCLNTVYTVPFFVENLKFKSTFITEYEKQGRTDYDVEHGAKLDQYLSSKNCMDMWVNHGKEYSIDTIMTVQMPHLNLAELVSRL
jgi:hypothetical protein